MDIEQVPDSGSEYEKTMGYRIRLGRVRKNFSQKNLVEKIVENGYTVSPSMMSGIELNNKAPSSELLEHIAAALEVTSDYLTTGVGNIWFDEDILGRMENIERMRMIIRLMKQLPPDDQAGIIRELVKRFV